MKCPECGAEMEEGRFKLEGTALGFLFFGFSYKNLVFKKDGGEKETALEDGEEAVGRYCPSCRLAMLKVEVKKEEQMRYHKRCGNCGMDNHHGGSRCISCGAPI